MLLDNSSHIQNIAPSQNIFWRGVVEENDDKGFGRCQVRILGIHSEDESLVPTSNLPWAEIMNPISSYGGVSGVGLTSIPVKGSWVWLFFDGGDWNKPIITGLIKGVTKDKNISTGFRDPTNQYPLDDRLNESDINRLATGTNFDKTIISKIRITNADKSIPTANGSTWGEMSEKSSKAKYPFNDVKEMEGGSIIEYDNTPGNERIHIFHKSGTYWEVQENGDYQIKITNNKKEIVDNDSYELVKSNSFTTIMGNEEYKIDGNSTGFIGGNSTNKIKGNNTLNVSGSTNEKHNGGLNVDGGPQINMKAGIINLN